MSERAKNIVGDCRTVLASMDADSADCCVTSPPYWGLRDYGNAAQIGLESSVDAWVAEMVAVFEGVRRVLRPSGTLWLNLGDAYAGSWGVQSREHAGKHAPNVSALSANQVKAAGIRESGTGLLARTPGMKAKDLIGQPWMVAFALRAAGWYLRADIIWHKPNPMPESVTDRPTKAHEYVFLLTKGPRYFYDAGAIAEAVSENTHMRVSQDVANQIGSERANGGTRSRRPMKTVLSKSLNGGDGLGVKARSIEAGNHKGPRPKQNDSFSAACVLPVLQRNSRSVWTIPTQGYKGAHFATFPRELAARCIKAGCPASGLVLDPFAGTGTTIAEAVLLGRRGVGIELNPEYARLAEQRIDEQCGLLARGAA